MDGSLKRKHQEIQDVPKRKGLFQEGAYPEHHYPIGDNFFVLVNIYAEKIGIHIRKFNRYDDSYYPSTVGLTLLPDQFNICFSNDTPTSIFDIADINMQLESVNPDNKREFYLLMADDGKIILTHEHTCRSGRIYKFPLNISSTQWREIRKVYDDVNSSYICLKLKTRDFLEIFKRVSKRQLPVEKPVYLPGYDHAVREINNVLTCVLYKNIGEKKGIRPPMRVGDEDLELEDLTSVKDFNESCMHLNVLSVVRDFEKELCENMYYSKNQQLIDFLSEEYLKAIHLDECIALARKDFCSEEI